MKAPVLTTERFELWRPERDDLPGLCALLDDEETRRFLGNAEPGEQPQFDRLMRHAGSWALHGYGNFYVRPHGGTQMIGSCGVFHSLRGFGHEVGMDDVPEAGWLVRRDHWGQGVAGEVMAAALAWFDHTHGRTHGTRRIACMIQQGNAASVRLAESLGFRRYGIHEIAGEGETPVRLDLYERNAGLLSAA